MPLRDQRRRRVLTDDVMSMASTAPRTDARSTRERDDLSDSPKPKRYAPAARRDRQPRLIDLVPSRYLTLGLWWLFGLAAVATLEIAYLWMPGLARLTGAAEAAVLDLAAERSLSRWFSALLLTTSALAAVLVYSLRRHRVDDYHGRYRIWLWTAAAFLVLSVDQTTGLSRLLAAAFAGLVERWTTDPGTAWTWVCAALLAFFGVRLLIEMYRSAAASAAWVCGCVSFVVSVAVELAWLDVGDPLHSTMTAAGCRMLAHLLSVTAVCLFARHVMLDAEGLLPVHRRRDAERPRRAAANSPDPDTKSMRVDAPEKPAPHAPLRSDLPASRPTAPVRSAAETPRGPLASAVAQRAERASAAAKPADSDSDDDDSSGRTLSRAERKRLKREMRRQQRDD